MKKRYSEIPKRKHEFTRRYSKNGLFIYSKKDKKGRRNSCYFSFKEESDYNPELDLHFFDLENEQFNFIY